KPVPAANRVERIKVLVVRHVRLARRTGVQRAPGRVETRERERIEQTARRIHWQTQRGALLVRDIAPVLGPIAAMEDAAARCFAFGGAVDPGDRVFKGAVALGAEREEFAEIAERHLLLIDGAGWNACELDFGPFHHTGEPKPANGGGEQRIVWRNLAAPG